jgi:TM2 domain-containing membrane protein YozV
LEVISLFTTHLRRSDGMAQPSKAALREKLTFEQQSRFDALYDRQQKKLGPATVLSMPLLGTFGLEQFYLGNAGQGILRLIFSWTLIPTVLALFEVATGDLKKQVAHANARVSQRVYNEVVQNTPSPASAPASVTDTVLTPNAATEAAALAAAASVASTPAPAEAAPPEPPVASVTETVVVTEAPPADATATPAAAPAAEVAQVSTDEQQEETTTTTSTFTVAESSASWQQGMGAPVSTGDEQTFTGGTTTDAVVEIAGADVTATPDAAAAPAGPSTAQSAAEAEPLTDDATASTTPPLAEEGVLVFVADEEPLASDVTVTETVQSPTETTTTTVEQLTEVQQQTDQVTVVEGEHVESQHYHQGKLVEASRHDVLLSGEINSLLTDTMTDTLLSEVEARAAQAPTPWLDVSPLQGGTPATPATGSPPSATPATPVAESPASAAAEPPTDAPRSTLIPNGGGSSGDSSGSDTNVPSGGIGGPATDVPGGGIGSPGTGTNVPGGGIGSPGTDPNNPGGNTGSGDSGGSVPPPHAPPGGERPI